MDLAPLVPWLSLIALLISVGTSITTLLTSGAKRNASTLIDHERRLLAIENDMKHLPDRDAQHRMELALTEMSGRFVALEEKLKPIALTSERLHELLLEQARK
ncbi:DUF2730 family protein [Brucella sp. TWI432]